MHIAAWFYGKCGPGPMQLFLEHHSRPRGGSRGFQTSAISIRMIIGTVQEDFPALRPARYPTAGKGSLSALQRSLATPPLKGSWPQIGLTAS